MTELLLPVFWVVLAALTVENLLLPNGLGLSRMLRSARKPRHRAWYALFVFLFSAVSLELSLLLPPQLFPAAWRDVLHPLALALLAAAAYALAAFLLTRLAPRFMERHGAVLAPAAVNTVVLAVPFAREALALGALQGLGYAAGVGLAFYLTTLALTPAYERARSQDAPPAFRGLPAALLYVAVLSLASLGFAGG